MLVNVDVLEEVDVLVRRRGSRCAGGRFCDDADSFCSIYRVWRTEIDSSDVESCSTSVSDG